MQIEKLDISINDRILFKNFSLELKENAVTGIYAPSGSGKTSLLNWMSGILEKPFVFSPFQDFGKISYVFQQPCLLDNLTVLQNVILPLNGHCSKKNAVIKAESYLEKAGILQKKHEYPCNLSGGEKQRVSLVRAFVYECDLLLLDEPFSSLDVENKQNMMNVLKTLIECSPVTAVFVSHDIIELKGICSKIISRDDFIV